MVAVGEIGLSGELRGVSQPERRISEAARLGFKMHSACRKRAYSYQGYSVDSGWNFEGSH